MNLIPPDIQHSLGDIARVVRIVEEELEEGEQKEVARDLLTNIIRQTELAGNELAAYRKSNVQSIIEHQNGVEDIILPITLPSEVDGPRQRLLMSRALDSKLIRVEDGRYAMSSHLSGKQAAYLCRLIFIGNDKTNKLFPAIVIEKLFGLHNLSTTISRLTDNYGSKPRGWQTIDAALAV